MNIIQLETVLALRDSCTESMVTAEQYADLEVIWYLDAADKLTEAQWSLCIDLWDKSLYW